MIQSEEARFEAGKTLPLYCCVGTEINSLNENDDFKLLFINYLKIYGMGVA